MAEQFHPAANVPLGVFNVVITGAAKTLQELVTAAGGGVINADVQHFTLLAETADVRWRDDGGVVTAAAGYLLSAGKELVVKNDRARLRYFKFIRTGGADVNASLWIGG